MGGFHCFLHFFEVLARAHPCQHHAHRKLAKPTAQVAVCRTGVGWRTQRQQVLPLLLFRQMEVVAHTLGDWRSMKDLLTVARVSAVVSRKRDGSDHCSCHVTQGVTATDERLSVLGACGFAGFAQDTTKKRSRRVADKLLHQPCCFCFAVRLSRGCWPCRPAHCLARPTSAPRLPELRALCGRRRCLVPSPTAGCDKQREHFAACISHVFCVAFAASFARLVLLRLRCSMHLRTLLALV